MSKSQTFEASLTRLEEIVQILEKGESSLEDSMKLFEEGTRLSKECGKKLETARQKIITLQEAESEAAENDG